MPVPRTPPAHSLDCQCLLHFQKHLCLTGMCLIGLCVIDVALSLLLASLVAVAIIRISLERVRGEERELP